METEAKPVSSGKSKNSGLSEQSQNACKTSFLTKPKVNQSVRGQPTMRWIIEIFIPALVLGGKLGLSKFMLILKIAKNAK